MEILDLYLIKWACELSNKDNRWGGKHQFLKLIQWYLRRIAKVTLLSMQICYVENKGILQCKSYSTGRDEYQIFVA